MAEVGLDLLDGVFSGAPVYQTIDPSQYENIENSQYFVQHFWGEKNQGFDVLYHNMKHGQTSVKSLQDFLRESISTEDLRAKHLTKLAKQAANSSQQGSFAPMFEVFKVMAEKISSCHMHVVQKLHEVVKDLSKYLDEQKAKHKQVKDELSGTVNTFHHVESTAAAVQKNKEKYYQLCMEAERLKRAGGSNKEIEKAETKAKKASEEYKNLVEKYATMRNEYEQKMTGSAKRFQETEVAHLKQMKTILDSYIGAYENANLLVGQVHQEFRRQVDENTIDSLIKNYSESKGTGTEKPTAIVFEECDVGSMLLSAEQAQSNVVNGDEPTPAPAPNKSRRPLNLPFRRKKGRRAKEATNGTKENDKETESMIDKASSQRESSEKDNEPKVDEEGYSIRPETPKGSRSSWGYGSSDDSDSDGEDTTYRKIHVKIKPKDENTSTVKENNIDTLNAITRNLTLSSPTPVGGKKLTRRISSRSIGSPMTHLSVSRSGSITSNDISTPPNSTPSEFPTSFSPPQLSTPSKAPHIPGAVRVIPLASSTSPKVQGSAPVPAPRKFSVKGDVSKLNIRRSRDLDSQNRFSTAFLDQDVGEFSKLQKSITAMTGKLNRDFSFDSDDEISDLTRSKSQENLSHSHKPSPSKRWLRLAPPTAPHPSPFSSSENILQPQILIPSPARSNKSASFDTPLTSPNFKPKPRASSDTPRPVGILKISGRQLTTNSANPIKAITIEPPKKQEKSTADELLDFFGNNSASSAPTPASSDPNSFLDLFKRPPVTLSGDTAKKLSSSSSDAALNLSSMSSDKSREGKDDKSKSFKLDPPISSSKSTPTNRPSNLTLNSSAPDLHRLAPLASAESWSSLSSLGGTPVESFATSRGPSPLTLSHGDPVPIAVSVAEIVNALFKNSVGDCKCVVKITGEVQISFPAGIVRAFTANKNPAVLSFAIKGCSNNVTFRPKHSFVFTDSSQTATSERSFWFDMTLLTNHIKTITDLKPNAPFYNISVLNYELLSQSGKSLVPLHLSSSWKCDTDSTDVTINYNFNRPSGSSLKTVQVLVPIDGGVTDHKSTPTATWNSSQKRLYWHVNSPISKNAPSGTLTSHLTLSSGPTKSKSLAVNFKSEGATLTGSEFELVGSGYRLSLVKKSFVSGKYILDEN